jgi:Bacterial regulatory proteins, tetR family
VPSAVAADGLEPAVSGGFEPMFSAWWLAVSVEPAAGESRRYSTQRIIESAVALHLERGPAQTSINAIAERAGVNRVTVYRHFPDERAPCSRHARSTRAGSTRRPTWTPGARSKTHGVAPNSR